jgi:hypothetical protein
VFIPLIADAVNKRLKLLSAFIFLKVWCVNIATADYTGLRCFLYQAINISLEVNQLGVS